MLKCKNCTVLFILVFWMSPVSVNWWTQRLSLCSCSQNKCFHSDLYSINTRIVRSQHNTTGFTSPEGLKQTQFVCNFTQAQVYFFCVWCDRIWWHHSSSKPQVSHWLGFCRLMCIKILFFQCDWGRFLQLITKITKSLHVWLFSLY